MQGFNGRPSTCTRCMIKAAQRGISRLFTEEGCLSSTDALSYSAVHHGSPIGVIVFYCSELQGLSRSKSGVVLQSLF